MELPASHVFLTIRELKAHLAYILAIYNGNIRSSDYLGRTLYRICHLLRNINTTYYRGKRDIRNFIERYIGNNEFYLYTLPVDYLGLTVAQFEGIAKFMDADPFKDPEENIKESIQFLRMIIEQIETVINRNLNSKPELKDLENITKEYIGYGMKKTRSNMWIEHVKRYKAKYGCSFKDAMKRSKESYKK